MNSPLKPIARTLLSCACLQATAALAQTAPAAPDAAASTPAATLPAVTVQGRTDRPLMPKDAAVGLLGDKPILDTPFTVNAYGSALIERQGAQTVSQLLRNDPAVTTMLSSGSFSGFGVGLRGFAAGSDNVSFDGLGPGVIFAGAKGQLFSIESVEVIKGPTAVLGGFSPFSGVGGSINLVPKRPLNQPLTALTLGYASQSLGTVHADISRRFGEQQQFGARFNGVIERGDTFYQGRDERDVAALALDWRAARGLVLSGGLDYVQTLSHRYQNSFAIAPAAAVPAAPDASKNLMQPWTYFGQDYRYGYLRADWDIDERWSLTVQALRGKSERSGYLSPGSPLILNGAGDVRITPSYVPPVDDTYPRFEGQNLFLRGKVTTGPVRHEVAAGFTRNAYESYGGSFILNAANGYPLYNTNLYAPVYYPEPALPASVPTGKQSEVDARGLLLSDTLSFDDAWSLLVGARRTQLDYQTFNQVTGVQTLDQAQSKTTPLAAVTWKPSVASAVYLSYAQGLERGSVVSGAQYTNNGANLPPIETEQLELGAKLQLDGGALLTAALFDIAKGLEYDVPLASDPTRLTKVQDGRQRNRGIELSAAGEVLRGLSVSGGLLLLKAEIENSGTTATSGKRPPGVPKITVPLYADWQVPGVPGLSLSGGAQHFGRQYVDATNTREIPSWTRLDAGAQYATHLAAQRVTFTANVENLTDRNYWASVSAGALSPGTPRVFKLSARVSF